MKHTWQMFQNFKDAWHMGIHMNLHLRTSSRQWSYGSKQLKNSMIPFLNPKVVDWLMHDDLPNLCMVSACQEKKAPLIDR